MPIFVVPIEEHGDPSRTHLPYPHAGGQGDGGRGLDAIRAREAHYVRPTPIRVKDIDEAVTLILQGKVVELQEVRQVNTVLTKLARIAQEALAKGEKAPFYDLCNVSVPGTNLFCASKLRTTEYPRGVPRIEMPQLGGSPVPGSPADALSKDAKGRVDGAPQFIEHLKRLGIKTATTQVPTARLKASQAQLVGATVAGLMTGPDDPGKRLIFISRDDYIVDGHHRWAAVVGRDAADGHLGSSMNVVRVDAPISEVLKIANAWSREFGIAQQRGTAN